MQCMDSALNNERIFSTPPSALRTRCEYNRRRSMNPLSGQPLSFEQVQRLCSVLGEPVRLPPKDPASNFPTLSITPAGIVKVVRQRLLEKGIKVCDLRMNGSAASYCLCDSKKGEHPDIVFNDVDLIFGVSIERECDFHVIKDEVLMSLLEFFPEETSTGRISSHLLEETYVRKMVLVINRDNEWSLISLGVENESRSIELKFVKTIKRQFEFTVDSFQIFLDDYFTYGKCAAESPVSITSTFFPTVHAVSVYGNFEEAMQHLNNRLIHTEAPEEIRGGGLLKYCTLLVNGFKPASKETIEHLEPYMCSRFFIDFPTTAEQHYKIHKCITTRFLSVQQFGKCQQFLDVLFRVISTRARCLMESERQKTISVLLHLIYQVGLPPVHRAPLRIYPFPPHPPPYIPLRTPTSGPPVPLSGRFIPKFSPTFVTRPRQPWSSLQRERTAQVR